MAERKSSSIRRWAVTAPAELERLFPGARFESLGDGPFEAQVTRRSLPRVTIEGISATPYLAVRSPADREAQPRPGLLLQVVLEGEGTVTRDGEAFDVGPGDVFLLRPDAPFEYRCSTWTRTFRVQVPEDALPLGVRNEYAPAFEPLQQTAVVCAFARFAADLLADDGCLEPDRTTGAHLEAALIALEQGVVAGGIASRSAAPNRRAALRAQVVESIETRLGDRELGPRAIADHHGVSVRTVHNLFADLPETAAEWIRRRRIEQATEVLRRRDATAAELAAELGFTTSDTFLRAFQRQQGVTPREYRKLLSDLGA